MYKHSEAVLDALDRVDALRAEIDSLRPLQPEQVGSAMQRLRLEWTYHSNAIEGNSLTYGETRALLLHGVTAQGKPLKDHLDIRGHQEALDYLERFVQEREELSLAAIRELHKLLLNDEPYDVRAETPDGRIVSKQVVPGRFKVLPNHVRTPTGEVHYFASPEETPSMMTDLLDWYKEERAAATEGDRHALSVAVELHHRFVAIHPFDDGNGRLARLLMNLVLMRAGYPPAIIRQENRAAYNGALAQADGGDLDPLMLFVAEELDATMRLYLSALRGEPDPEAFDRRLALLRRRAETVVTNGDVERSTEVLHEMARDFLIPYFKRLQARIVDVGHDFFNGVTFVVQITSPSGDGTFVRDGFPDFLSERDWISFQGHWSLEGYLAAPDRSLSLSFKGQAGRNELTLSRSGVGMRPKPPVIRLPYARAHSEDEAIETANRDLEALIAAVEMIQQSAEENAD